MTTNTALLDFQIVPNAAPMPEAERLKAFENLGFGTLFTDHMAVVHWHVDKGWHSPEVSARKPFQIDPAASVLHYAQEIFEGMKAYRHPDGGAALFPVALLRERAQPNPQALQQSGLAASLQRLQATYRF
mgnify:CR=1 FL=1